MPDGDVPLEMAQFILGEGLGNQSHSRVKVDPLPVAGGDAGAFLPPMLKGVESKKC
ncbi:hypothetical protein ES703_67812 [subsurface metagenome]